MIKTPIEFRKIDPPKILLSIMYDGRIMQDDEDISNDDKKIADAVREWAKQYRELSK